MNKRNLNKFLLVALFVPSAIASGGTLEVLHWWTSPGEKEAQQILDVALRKQNITWENFAIVGSGGDSALRVLQMRALSGNPPDAAQIKGPDIAEWASMGMLKEIDHIIPTTEWDKYIHDVVKKTVSYQDHFMALPLNIHRVNWLWLNTEIFEQLQLSPPKTWDDFFKVAEKIKAAGYIPIAHGGTSWQDSLLFESVVLSLLGAEKYKQAFVDFDETVLTSHQMVQAFETFKRINQYVSHNMRGKDWVDASEMLTNKEAGMLFMGDWAKGLWHASGKVAIQDYLCVNVPGTENIYSYNIDSFVFFKKHSTNDLDKVNNRAFANTLISKPFQQAFNIEKGSIPVRKNMDMQAFDACAQKSYVDFYHGSKLVPSFSQNMATSSYLQSEMSKIISYYFRNDDVSSRQAAKQLALAIRAVNK
ncbi:carbohydrate ABC transporter substrate-binding protein [Psychromonas sp. psych-6C06]|uniref:ABC transporter substrate-binding protein n=1 Tax=Psychromonas sp. psych-6C06 TaxID=2058089 RepID=UPI000C34B373|nr:ABC transporter substrate-binding protein [Psychromonas sp. psych-6C06]PKF63700.1 carbohydrate ABC transporter substrate-binding protein [Psychromonas sp. psych-6C06]